MGCRPLTVGVFTAALHIFISPDRELTSAHDELTSAQGDLISAHDELMSAHDELAAARRNANAVRFDAGPALGDPLLATSNSATKRAELIAQPADPAATQARFATRISHPTLARSELGAPRADSRTRLDGPEWRSCRSGARRSGSAADRADLADRRRHVPRGSGDSTSVESRPALDGGRLGSRARILGARVGEVRSRAPDSASRAHLALYFLCRHETRND